MSLDWLCSTHVLPVATRARAAFQSFGKGKGEHTFQKRDFAIRPKQINMAASYVALEGQERCFLIEVKQICFPSKGFLPIEEILISEHNEGKCLKRNRIIRF